MFKNKWMIAVLVLLLVAALAAPAVLAQDQAAQAVERPQLTDEQREEIKALHDEMWTLKKRLVEKYTEFGVMDEDHANKMLERMESRKNRMEEKGFEPWTGMGCKGERRMNRKEMNRT